VAEKSKTKPKPTCPSLPVKTGSSYMYAYECSEDGEDGTTTATATATATTNTTNYCRFCLTCPFLRAYSS